MRFQHVIERVYGNAWQITPSGWYAIHQIVMAHFDDLPGLESRAREVESKRPQSGWFGPIDQMRIDKGVAIIPIKGSLVKGASMFEKSCGAVSHDDIHEDLDNALAAGVRGIVLDVNSPGGMVTGTPEVAGRIASLRKKGVRVLTFTDELNGSAAYYMSAGAAEVYATGSATIGSIGTIWEFYNVVNQLQARGITYEVFTSGPYKGMGHPAKELTEEQRAFIQAHVEMHSEQFKDHVRNHRPKVREESMQGQIFTGSQALAAGLVDGLVDSLAEVVELARGR